MSNSRALNTVSRYTLFGTAAGFAGGFIIEAQNKNPSGYLNMGGLLIILGISAGATAGFLLGMAKALFDECSNSVERRSLGVRS